LTIYRSINPFSEAQFKTLKYQPDYPGIFHGRHDARAWASDYFPWYNTAHHHHGLALYAPETLFFGRVDAVAAQRQLALDAAFELHPERFVRGRPIAPRPPTQVSINPVAPEAPLITAAELLRSPDLDLLFVSRPPPHVPIVELPGACAPSLGGFAS
jgi:putative transposase